MKVRHAQVESWMIDMVRRKLSEFDYHGKLDNQHYSFCKTGVVAPFPVFHHLLFCYNRTARRLQLKLGCSLLFRWQLRRSEGRVTHVSKMLACDLSGHSRFVKSRAVFEDKLDELLVTFFPERTRELVQDEVLLEGMHQLLKEGALSKKSFSSKDISDLTLVMKQRGSPSEEDAEVKEQEQESKEFDAFLADLVPEQAQVSGGSFTLNAAKAAAKLQRYQLSSPQNFVVHLVGGAIAGGATQVRVYVDSDDIMVEFDGSPMSEGELSELLDSMFNPHASMRSKELAVALNAAMSLTPRSLKVETWHQGRGFELQVRGRGKVSALEPVGDRLSLSHRISFRDHLSLRVAHRFLNSLRTDHPELDLLRERCGLGPVPVLLDGQELRSLPLQESAAFLLWEHPDHPLGDWDLSSLPGLKESSPGEFSALFLVGPEPGLQVRVNGVLYEAPPMKKPWSCWCLVVNDKLTRDLSYTGINEDAMWARILLEIPKALSRLTTYSVGIYPESEGERRAALSGFLRDAGHNGAEEAFQLPVFPTTDGRYSTLKLLIHGAQILYTNRSWKYPLRSGEEAFQLDERDLALLENRRMGIRSSKPVLADRDLEVSQNYFRKREQWLQEPQQEVKLGAGYQAVKDLSKYTGQIGLLRGQSTLRLYALGRPLPEWEKAELPPGVHLVLNHDEIEVSNDWKRIRRGPILDSIKKFVEKEADSFLQGLFRHKGVYTVPLLEYLSYRKRKGKAWEHLLKRLHFRVLGDEPKSWAELNEEGEGLGAELKTVWQRIFHLSLREKRLMSQLLD